MKRDHIDVPKFVTEHRQGDEEENNRINNDKVIRICQIVGSIFSTMFLMKFGVQLISDLRTTFIILGCLVCISWIMWTIRDQGTDVR